MFSILDHIFDIGPKDNISQVLSPLLNWLEYGATKSVASIPIWVIPLRVRLDDPCGFLTTQNSVML